ncbi:MAG: hypothetical protein H6817_04685 [Phycisphaerales bacterium]|nr:hypothetical protein [Phycisphaerales bacterium]
MAKASLRRYDIQAKLALYISCAAALLMLGLFVILIRNFRPEMQVIAYKGKGIYGPMVYVATALSILLAGTGAAMGAVSAGQKRNTFSRRSWVAFFMGGLTMSITFVLFYWFMTTGFRI